MRRVSRVFLMVVLGLFCPGLFSACVDPGDPILPTEGYLGRKGEYLQYCFENNGPGQGGVHGQVCRLYLDANSFNEEKLDEALDEINAREDTADFGLNTVLRLLHLNRRHPSLGGPLRERLETAVLNFKYWLDEPGPDEMCWWSENHQILFHTAELLAGQLFPDSVFPNSGMTGAEHAEHAVPLILRWLDFRGRFGFSEFHSNVYFNEDIPPLVNLADFAEDPEIRTRAAMVLDVLAFDLACNYYRGLYATPHGRTYPSKLLGGLNDSTREAAYVLLGLGEAGSPDNFSAAFLATSDSYCPPAVLEALASEAAGSLEHRQRDSIDVRDGPWYGIGYREPRDVMFWWGATGYVAPEVIDGTFRMVEDFSMWEGFLWKDLAFLRPLVGSPLLPLVSLLLEDMSRGVALESAHTYTYRTPHYQLSGAQDFKPGSWTGQVHVWQATLDRDAYVFTSYPGGMEGDYAGGLWTGGFVPRATLHKNVGIVQYRRPRIPILDEVLFTDYSHAYFPRNEFDEFVQAGNWVMGRKADAYVALYSEHPPAWSADNDYELIADAKENVWIVELGDRASDGPFSGFVDRIRAAEVRVGETVLYHSPSRGVMSVGWEGPLTVDGAEVEPAPDLRWDNRFCRQPFGTRVTDIRFGGQRLELDFNRGLRRTWVGSR
jgi:hypothetical protein